MQEEAVRDIKPNKGYAEFRALTAGLRELVKKRNELLKLQGPQQELMKNSQEAMVSLMGIRQIYRELHKVRKVDEGY